MAVSSIVALRSSLAVVAVALLMASQSVSARPATKRGLLQGPGPSLDSSGLDFNYYATKCPQAQQIVADKVASFAAQFPPGQVTGALLRLIFHDAFVRGGDGSVLIDSTPDNTAEKGALLNFALDPVGFEVVDGIKAALEEACPRTVSCADILALGSREAVFQAGGPHFEVPLGRLDGHVSLASEADADLPNPAMNTSQLIDNFAAKGLNQQDMVVLSGAHTLGITHCASFFDRLLPTLDSTYPEDLRALLQSACNTGLILECFNQVDLAKCLAAGVVSMEENDQNFNAQFDNTYYQRLTEGYGIFTSDVTLFRDPRTQGLIQQFAQDQASWFTAFTASLLDMARIGVQLAPEGTRVRTNCRVVDS